jgi:NTP pyrophosphatase (non-canonical NTP hydrolase)
MFNDIYPRDDSTNHETNVHRLSEELGELCEAVRTLFVAPEYFVSEAPDVFAWLMGFANQFDFDNRQEIGNQLQRDMSECYPGYCKSCQRQVCKCTPIHPDTLGRIAKEAPLDVTIGGRLFSLHESVQLFRRSMDELHVSGRTIVPDHLEVSRIKQDVTKLLIAAQSQTDWQAGVLVTFAAALGGIEKLTAQGEITQRAVDDLKLALEKMPSEKRSVIVGFLNNLAASGTFQAISAGLQALNG